MGITGAQARGLYLRVDLAGSKVLIYMGEPQPEPAGFRRMAVCHEAGSVLILLR